jgi:heme oxygenase (biliverdin-IX-beta and delta-forming)
MLDCGATLMLKCLKDATSTRHAALERRLPLLDANLSHTTYCHFVQRLFGFYDPLETRLLALPWWEVMGIDYVQRRKTPRLRHDLQTLGDTEASIAALPRCADLPPLTNPAQLWGCLYVIEGATLGGQIIIKNLNLNLGLTAASGASFFDGYGAQTGSRWKAFCASVPGEDFDAHGGAEAMLCSANLTFDVFSEWLFPGSVTTPGRDFIEAG